MLICIQDIGPVIVIFKQYEQYQLLFVSIVILMFNSESHLGRTAAESITIIYHQTAAIQSTNQSPHYDRLPQPSTPYQATNIFPNIRLHAGGVFQYTGSDPMILSLDTVII